MRGQMKDVQGNRGDGVPIGVLWQVLLRLPYPNKSSVTLLGVTFGGNLSFTKQLSGALERAKVRLAVLGRLAGSSQGLGARILRLAHKALSVCLVKYGLVLVGSGASDAVFSHLGTRVIDAASRRKVGVGGSAGLIILHIVTGVFASRNMYVSDGACNLDRALRGLKSSSQARLPKWLAGAQVGTGPLTGRSFPMCLASGLGDVPLEATKKMWRRGGSLTCSAGRPISHFGSIRLASFTQMKER